MIAENVRYGLLYNSSLFKPLILIKVKKKAKIRNSKSNSTPDPGHHIGK